MSYLDYVNIIPVNYTTEELNDVADKLDAERDELIEECSKKIAEISKNPKFDPYSFWGNRKIKKITKYYSNKTGKILGILDIIDEELSKREQYEYEQSFLGKGKVSKDKYISKEQFINQEMNKTNNFKKYIDVDE